MPLPATTPGTVEHLAVSFAATVLDHDPLTATLLGLHERDTELGEVSPQAVEAAQRAFSALRREIAGLEVTDPEDEVDRRGLAAMVDSVIAGYTVKRSLWRNPMVPPQAATNGVLVPLVFEQVPDREAAVAGRLAALPAYLEQARAILEPGEVPPLWCQMAVATATGSATFLGEVVARAFPAVAGAAGTAAEAMRRHAAWLSDEVSPLASGDYALGEAGLRELLGSVHLLDESPEQVMARGHELLDRGEEALRDAAGGRDWREALAEARTDHPDHGALVDSYRAEVESLRQFCFDHDLVSDPQAPAEVQETPEYMRPVMGYAAYMPSGAFDEARSGKLWVTPPPDDEGLADHSYSHIQPISAHEGYPGHHLQMTAVNRLDRTARRLRGGSSLMIEGWGLYVEELMHEAGYYAPAARVVQLAMTQWRAARIVADIGLHTGDLDTDAALDLLTDRAGISRTTALSEVNRYTTTPLQPFTYLYGAEEIRRIRAGWRERTGGSLRAFHDALLAYGHLPPALVADRLLDGTGSGG